MIDERTPDNMIDEKAPDTQALKDEFMNEVDAIQNAESSESVDCLTDGETRF